MKTSFTQKSRFLALLLSIAVIVSSLPFTVATVSATPEVVQTVTTETELRTAITNGSNIMLGNDIYLNDTGLTIAGDKTVTIDLGGHTLSGDNLATPTEVGQVRCVFLNKGTLTVKNGTLKGGKGCGTNVLADSKMTVEGIGGTIHNWAGCLTLENCTVTGGTAYLGGGINSVEDIRGGTYLECQLIMKNSTVTDCSAEYGGGIYNNCTATLTNIAIDSCSAEYGGGIYNNGTATLTNIAIDSCSAEYGGGIYNSGIATLTDVTVESCSAEYGGGVFDNEKLTLSGNTQIQNNTVKGYTTPSNLYYLKTSKYTKETPDQPTPVPKPRSAPKLTTLNDNSEALLQDMELDSGVSADDITTNTNINPVVTLTNFTGSAGVTVVNMEGYYNYSTGDSWETYTDNIAGCFATTSDLGGIGQYKSNFTPDDDDYEVVVSGTNLALAEKTDDPTPTPTPTPTTTTYTITATATDGGTITPSGAVKVEKGKNKSFTATPNENYTLEKFVVDGKDEYINGNTYTFEKVNAKHTIQAVFTKKEEPQPEPEPEKFTGWKETNGKWQYIVEDKALTGWQNNIKGWEGQWFYFDNAGIMQTGWVNNIPGWNNWFYFDRKTGVMQKGWAFVDDGHGDFTNKLWYYLDTTTGAMHIDWQKIDGKWYYLDYNRNNWGGAMQTGWQFIPYSGGQAWFCFATNGAMYENCTTPDGYYVDDKGVWVQ